jgi:glycosyltransferase involved in cell wall biosynthesis
MTGRAEGAGPRTSVVVPVLDDPDGLETTVRSLLDQSGDEYEVVIADNGSTDRTPRVAERFARRDRVVHVIEDDVRGSYAARNAGIEAAEGEVIGFVDADMWVDRHYVESITRAMRDDDRVYMGCDVEVVDDGTPTARFDAATAFPVRDYVENLQFAPTCALVVDRCLFESVGRFDRRVVSGGDVEFGRRVAAAGYDLTFEPGIVLYHPARERVRELVSKWFRVGRGDEQLRRRHPDRFDGRSPFHPRNFLPGSPPRFGDRLRTEPTSAVELTYWFLLDWTCQLARSAGRIDEYTRDPGAETPATE